MDIKVICNKDYHTGEIDPRIYGSFVEHMGRVVYSGIYEPGHQLADSDGFRMDVLQSVNKMGVTCVRYPGGNFVSAYDWLDGVGLKELRPRKLDIAWHSIETNEFGTNEFMHWAKTAKVEPILTVNLGTKGIENAISLLEYCNMPVGTKYSNMRGEHGFEQPYRIKTWCLGNEMDGVWQIGHKTADEYGRLALETGKAMKLIDPEIELIACGSAKSDMVTHPEWDIRVLDYVYDIADYLSIHQYYGGQHKGTKEFLAQALDMERYIETIRAAITLTKQKKRSNKQLFISIDEWGVWVMPPESDDSNEHKLSWDVAPALGEQIYTMEDALLFSSMLMSIVRNADIVKIGCQSLLTNISACIMTNRDGGLWKQTIYYPFHYIATYGQGTVIQLAMSSPTYDCECFNAVPYLDAIAVLNEVKKELVLFTVNRSETDEIDLDFELQGFIPDQINEFVTIFADDVKQTNYVDHNAVIPHNSNEIKLESGCCHAILKPLSFSMIRIAIN